MRLQWSLRAANALRPQAKSNPSLPTIQKAPFVGRQKALFGTMCSAPAERDAPVGVMRPSDVMFASQVMRAFGTSAEEDQFSIVMIDGACYNLFHKSASVQEEWQ